LHFLLIAHCSLRGIVMICFSFPCVRARGLQIFMVCALCLE